jgi:hypothetical protein
MPPFGAGMTARVNRPIDAPCRPGASQESADSHVYASIHFRSACQDGIKQGERIGRRAVAQFLQPGRGPPGLLR